MIYIYDIMLNLNKNIIEFFEWEDTDNVNYIRKIPLYRINSIMMKDIIKNNVIVDTEFLKAIYNKCVFNDNYIVKYEYLSLLSDGKTILGILFKDDGSVLLLSKLLIDEEREILSFINKLQETKITYKIKCTKNTHNDFLTRKEIKIKNRLELEIKKAYKENKIDRLNYYFYEYFGYILNNKKEIYNKLLDSITTSFNDKHLYLYDLIKLSYQHK